MRAIVWPEGANFGNGIDVENYAPNIIHLLQPKTSKPTHEDCHITQEAITARFELIEALAEIDTTTEEYYLNDREPGDAELRAALRRTTLAQKAVPVMAAAALRGKEIGRAHV